MDIWQLWGIIGLILVIIEMFTPVLFFLNLAFAAIVLGVITYYYPLSFNTQLITFAVLSFVLLVFLRPLLLKVKNEPEQSGVEATYFGKTATVTTKITQNSGRITIFGEDWNAKTKDGSEIEENEQVKIVDRDGLTMIVERL